MIKALVFNGIAANEFYDQNLFTFSVQSTFIFPISSHRRVVIEEGGVPITLK